MLYIESLTVSNNRFFVFCFFVYVSVFYIIGVLLLVVFFWFLWLLTTGNSGCVLLLFFSPFLTLFSNIIYIISSIGIINNMIKVCYIVL